jgi:glucose/arabinose dehydrogenase
VPTWTPPPGIAGTAQATLPATGVSQALYHASPCSDKYPCDENAAGWEARLRLPDGFEGEYFARVDGSPTSLAFGPDGLLYVALQEGQILTVDEAGAVGAFLGGLNTPTGIAFLPGTDLLYVSDRVRNENSGGEAQVSIYQDGRLRQLFGGIPCCYTYLHSANGIAFGPDGYGYVTVGARADHGEILDGSNRQDALHRWEASILRFSPDGAEVEPYAHGLRNAYDLAWDAAGQLYATDNAPDFGPPDELHRIVPGGQHGYPWYECDTCFAAPAGVELIPPLHTFIPHAAAAGITVYLAEQFPGFYNNLFVVLWSAFEGAQKIVRFAPGGQGAVDFATGFAQPIDVVVGPDGSLYVADYATGVIFRLRYAT